MSISLIRKADIVARIPDRWAAQYASHASASQREITASLAALKGTSFTAEDCAAIIGNDTWGLNRCSECDEDHPVLVRIGEEPDYEARWVDLCPACLAQAVAAAGAA